MMKKRLATTILAAIMLAAVVTPAGHAQDSEDSRATLKGLTAVYPLLDSSPDGAKKLGLTDEMIRTDVELKLRLAGLHVLTNEEGRSNPNNAAVLHVSVTATEGARAECILVQLGQNVQLRRNGAFAYYVPTWSTGTVAVNLNAQDIRDEIKDEVDRFLNAWLSVNPKK